MAQAKESSRLLLRGLGYPALSRAPAENSPGRETKPQRQLPAKSFPGKALLQVWESVSLWLPACWQGPECAGGMRGMPLRKADMLVADMILAFSQMGHGTAKLAKDKENKVLSLQARVCLLY